MSMWEHLHHRQNSNWIILSCTDKQRSQRTSVSSEISQKQLHQYQPSTLFIQWSDVKQRQWKWLVVTKYLHFITKDVLLRLQVERTLRYGDIAFENKTENSNLKERKKIRQHAKSHTYHKHGLGYAIKKKGGRRIGDIAIIC